MKKIFFITILSTIYFTNSIHAQWADVSIPVSYDLDKSSFPDYNYGYVQKKWYPIVYRTTNGGVSWDSIQILGGPIHDIEFTSPDTGFALVEGPFGQHTLKVTYNYGNTWVDYNIPYGSYYGMMRFASSTTGFLCQNDTIIRSTSDGGQNWSSPISAGAYIMTPNDKEYTGTDTIIFTGTYTDFFVPPGAVRRSDNGGSTWQSIIHDSTTSGFNGTHFLSGKNGYCVYTQYWPIFRNRFDKTTDGGITWSNIISDTTSNFTFTDVFMTSATEGYIALQDGSIGKILKVNGSSATVDYTTNYPLRRFYKGGSTLFAVGDNGKVVKRALPIFGIEPTINSLIGVYPNPTNDIVNIPIEIKSEINIVDINGKTILSKTISPGELLSLSHLANGIYCIKVKNEKGISVGRIIVNH